MDSIKKSKFRINQSAVALNHYRGSKFPTRGDQSVVKGHNFRQNSNFFGMMG